MTISDAADTSVTSTRGARRFWTVLGIILLLGTAVRALILWEYTSENPFAFAPRSDALVYWRWAGKMAAGQWLPETPFLSAPLYPFLLGLIQWCGGGLVAVYVIQCVLNVGTAALLAWIGRVQFNALIGWLAAGVFLLMLDPTADATRTLASTLQVFLAAVLWAALVQVWKRRSAVASIVAGLLLGANCLATPPMLLLVPLVPLWMLWSGGNVRVAWHRPVLSLLGTIIVIAPVTIHNYHTAGELIPVSAHSGITLYQGNGPGARWTYTPVPGVSPDRERMHEDAARVYEKETGRPGSWSEIDGFFRRKAIDRWRADPPAAIALLARKAYAFLTARNYGDIYTPEAEISAGLATLLNLAPLRTAWLTIPSVIALVGLARRLKTHLPALLLFALPWFVCTVFFYSPRYRVPATPVIALATAWLIGQALSGPTRRRWIIILLAGIAASIGLGIANRATGFDVSTQSSADFNCILAAAYATDEQWDSAVEHYESALREAPEHGRAQLGLARAFRELDRLDDAETLLRAVIARKPSSIDARNILGICLVRMGRPADAVQQFRHALAVNPGIPQTRTNLGNALSEVGRALLIRRDYARAAEALREACQMAPTNLTAINDLAWLLATCPRSELRNGAEAVRLAERACEATAHSDANLLDTLAAAYAEIGQFADAVETIKQALAAPAVAANADLAAELTARLRLYEAGQPYRAAD